MRLAMVRRALAPTRARVDAARATRRWNARARNFYGAFIRAGDLCFDVGANVGNRTAVVVAVGARVVAVEPQRECADRLRRRFGSTGRVTVVEAAAGSAPGEAQLRLTDFDTVSTLSQEWIERVRGAGRFDLEWSREVTVPVTTLDDLIASHGEPVFCKIDVEGYEREVLEGLSRPLSFVSFASTPEYEDAAFACIRRLMELGMSRFAYSAGESLELGERMPAETMIDRLAGGPHDGRAFGDVYAALTESVPSRR